MRALIQRVSEAGVEVGGKPTGAIQRGLLVFLGIEDADNADDIAWLVSKIVNLRIFDDDNHIPNFSVRDVDGGLLIVSQFTLHASTKKGNRPGYSRASKRQVAEPLYEQFIRLAEVELGGKVACGIFGADMKVHLVNDGPVTIWIDSKNRE